MNKKEIGRICRIYIVKVYDGLFCAVSSDFPGRCEPYGRKNNADTGESGEEGSGDLKPLCLSQCGFKGQGQGGGGVRYPTCFSAGPGPDLT